MGWQNDEVVKPSGGWQADEVIKPAKGPREVPDTLGGQVGSAVTGAAANVASASLAAPIAGLAGIVGGLVPGPQGQSRDWAEKVQGALTMNPQTKAGSVLADVVTKPFQWLSSGADAAGQVVSDKTGSPALGAAVNTAIQMSPAILSKLGGERAREAIDNRIGAKESAAADANSRASVKAKSLNDALEAGYVVPPSAKDAGFATRRIEGVAGKAGLTQEVQIRNQQVTDSLARKAIEVPDNIPLTEKVLQQKRTEFGKPYQDIADLSPIAAKALENLKQARADANSWYVYHERNGHPAALKRAERFSERAEMLERVIEREASKAGQPGLLESLREARQKIAKTYDVEAALNLGNGEISARAIGRMLDKGKPLSGELATIGRFDQAFNGRYTRPGSAVPQPSGTALEAPASVVLGGQGGMLAAGIPFLAEPARNLLLSRLFQQPMSPQTYSPGLGLRGASLFFDPNAPLPLAGIQAGVNGK